jgi:hypothetical protein
MFDHNRMAMMFDHYRAVVQITIVIAMLWRGWNADAGVASRAADTSRAGRSG